jgi:hypothetical protein
MQTKGVLLAMAVAARVAVLVPAAGLAWLIWQR